MGKVSMIGLTAIFLGLGVVAAKADSANVPRNSQYAVMGYDSRPIATPAPAPEATPMDERRAAYERSRRHRVYRHMQDSEDYR